MVDKLARVPGVDAADIFARFTSSETSIRQVEIEEVDPESDCVLSRAGPRARERRMRTCVTRAVQQQVVLQLMADSGAGSRRK